MGIKDFLNHNSKLKKWEENKDVIEQEEIRYLNILKSKYKEEIDKIKTDFNNYLIANKVTPKIKSNFIYAIICDNLKIRIDLNDVKPTNFYQFGLSVIKEINYQYVITIYPTYDVYVPSIYKNRPTPKNNDHIEIMIRQIENDYNHLQTEFEKLNMIEFYLTARNSQHNPDNISILTKYHNIVDIVENLI